MSDEAIELASHYGYNGCWNEHHQYLPADWEREVAEGNTRASYWDWVIAQLDLED